MRTIRAAIIALTLLVVVGCNNKSPESLPVPPSPTASAIEQVTLYLPNMNKELKIL